MTEQDFSRTYNELADHVNAKIQEAGGSLSALETAAVVRRWVEGRPAARAVLSAFTVVTIPTGPEPWDLEGQVVPSQDGGYLRRLLDVE
jgi:hypothetical protein